VDEQQRSGPWKSTEWWFLSCVSAEEISPELIMFDGFWARTPWGEALVSPATGSVRSRRRLWTPEAMQGRAAFDQKCDLNAALTLRVEYKECVPCSWTRTTSKEYRGASRQTWYLVYLLPMRGKYFEIRKFELSSRKKTKWLHARHHPFIQCWGSKAPVALEGPACIETQSM
jgi:hypothetical protein